MRYSAPGMWGTANYFAVNASYSHNYAHLKQALVLSVVAVALILATRWKRYDVWLRIKWCFFMIESLKLIHSFVES